MKHSFLQIVASPYIPFNRRKPVLLVANETSELSPKPPNGIFPQRIFSYFQWLNPVFNCSLSCRKHHLSVANELSRVLPKPPKAPLPMSLSVCFRRLTPFLVFSLSCRKQYFLVANKSFEFSPKPPKVFLHFTRSSPLSVV